MTNLHCRLRLRSRRVHHPCHPCKYQIPFQLLRRKKERLLVPFPKRHRHHAQGICRHLAVFQPCLAFSSAIKYSLSAAIQAVCAFLKKNIGCPLRHRNPFPPTGMHRCHQLSLRGKRYLADSGHFLPKPLERYPAFLCRLRKCLFRRLPNDFCPLPLHIIAKRKQRQNESSLFLVLLQALPDCRKPCHLHAVLRQRPRLIRADDLCAPQGFHRRQSADNRIFPCHPLHPNCKHNRHNRRQSFGNCRHRKAHRGHKHRKRRLPSQKPHPEDNAADNQRPHAKQLSCLPQFFLQGRFALLLLRQKGCNLSNFGRHARCRHRNRASPRQNVASCKHHVFAVARQCFLCQNTLLLLNRKCFPRNRAFLRFQPLVFQNPPVRANIIPCRKQKNIPLHYLLRRNFLLLAISQHACLWRRKCLQCLQCLFRSALLQNAQKRIQCHNRQNDCRIQKILLTVPIGNRNRSHSRPNQQQYHKIIKLRQKPPLEALFALSLLRSVPSVRFQPLLCLVFA